MMALNNREKWIVFHKSSMNEYLDLWKDSDLRSQIEISLEETAYYLLENAAALWRYTGNEVYKNDFKDFPLEERKKLVSAACKYINSSSLPEQARKITVTDALSDDKIDQAESIFLLRDGLQGVLDISKCVVDDILLNDKEMLSNLTDAFCVASEIDELLLDRPDIASIASRIMEPFKEMIKIDVSSDDYWWFYKARKWDEMENAIFSDSRLLAENLGLVPAIFAKNPILSKWEKLFSTLSTSTETATNKFKALAKKLKLAGEGKVAACGLAVSGIADFINQLSEQTDFALTGVQARGIDNKNNFDLDSVITKAKIKLLTPPKQDLDNLENTTVQWSVSFEKEIEIKDCLAVVINVESDNIIGVAQFISKEHTATLIEGLWKDFEPVIDSPESIMLLFLHGNN